jgi:class 3 adenylate cyclase
MSFTCSKCGTRKYTFPALPVPVAPEQTIKTADFWRDEVLQRVREGTFRTMNMADLDLEELNLREMVARYFRVFGCLFFEHAHDFWKCFVDTFTAVFKCDFQAVLAVLDDYGRSLLYETVERNQRINFGICREFEYPMN